MFDSEKGIKCPKCESEDVVKRISGVQIRWYRCSVCNNLFEVAFIYETTKTEVSLIRQYRDVKED